MTKPGLAVVWSAGRARFGLAIPPGGELQIGRKLVAAGDDRISGKHARIRFEGGQFLVEDTASTNGTYIAGTRQGRAAVPPGTVIRCGRTIGILVEDLDALADPDPVWLRDIVRLGTAREHLTIEGRRGSDRMRAALRYAAAGGGTQMLFDPLVDTRGLHVPDDVATLIVTNPRLLGAADRDQLAKLYARPQLRVVMSTVKPLDMIGLPQHGPIIRIPRLRDDLPSIVDIIVDQLEGTGSAAHERVVEQCLIRDWPGEAIELRAAMIDSRRIAIDEASPRIMKAHLRKTAGQPVPPTVKSFVDCYVGAMNAQPSFPIPDDYLVMMRSDEHEQMIASLHAVEHGPILTQADIMRISSVPRGWFQAGFWGHGVNSYAFYLAEVTDRHRTLIRLPYGGGAYSSPDESVKAVAQLERYRKFRALPPEHVAEALLVDSYDHLYDVVNGPGRRLVVERTPGLLDFDALAARMALKAV